MKRIKLLMFIIIIILAVIGVLIAIGNIRSKSVAGGVVNDHLTVCPNSPNCVSSADKEDSSHYFSSVSITQKEWIDFKSKFSSLPNTQIITQTENYVHIVFTTSFFRFKDDVEFLYLEKQNRLELRSASRIGKSDLGANRKRMTELVGKIGE